MTICDLFDIHKSIILIQDKEPFQNAEGASELGEISNLYNVERDCVDNLEEEDIDADMLLARLQLDASLDGGVDPEHEEEYRDLLAQVLKQV